MVAATRQARYLLGSSPDELAIGDLNGDGKPDLALSMPQSGAGSSVAVLLNRGSGAFGPPVEFTAGAAPGRLAIGDLDGDGRLDLAVEDAGHTLGTTNEGAGVSVLLNRGGGSFFASATYDEAGAPAIGDLNGDGKADLVILTAMDGAAVASVRLNMGGGIFSAPATYPAGSVHQWVGLADMDSDGDLDLVAGGHSVLPNRGDGTFAAAVNTMASDGAFVVGDLNGDGVEDLAVLNRAGGISVLVGSGKGATSLATTYAASAGDSRSIALGDVNGDGKPDLVAAVNGSVAVLLNTSDWTK